MKKIGSPLRFIFGLAILVWLFFGIPTITHQSPFFMVMVSLSTLAPVILPLIVIAGYFLFTGKFRWRLDIIALIVAIICLVTLNRMLNVGRLLLQGSIKGDIKLEVNILKENSQPVADLEVDVAKTPGIPPEGGINKTDNNGVAIFYLQPNVYTIYFNSGNFPSDLRQPENLIQVKIEKEKINKETIILKRK